MKAWIVSQAGVEKGRILARDLEHALEVAAGMWGAGSFTIKSVKEDTTWSPKTSGKRAPHTTKEKA